jgi:thioredoxin-like negative regulator of GroEL
MSIPTMILFKNGSEVDRIIGAVPEEAVTDFASQ